MRLTPDEYLILLETQAAALLREFETNSSPSQRARDLTRMIERFADILEEFKAELGRDEGK